MTVATMKVLPIVKMRALPDESDIHHAGQLPADPDDGTVPVPIERAMRVPAMLTHTIRQNAPRLDAPMIELIERVGVPLGRLVEAKDDDTRAAAMNELRTAVAPPPNKQPREPLSPIDVCERWRIEGPIVRVSTGIAPIDAACRGGFPVPWRVVIVGAPSAGKTFLEIAIADTLARAADAAGLCVGVLAVDEDPEDITIRMAQIAGFAIDEIEARDPAVLADIEEALRGLRIRLYPSTWTIDSAADDLAKRAATDGRRAALFIDSAQTAMSRASSALRDPMPRLVVEANMAAIRSAAERHRMLVITTSEANRASYRNDDAAEQSNDMAAGAESRTLEFSAQTLLMLRTPKNHPDVIHVRITKNRRHKRGVEFWLRLDRDQHRLAECPDPTLDPAAATKAEEKQRAGVRAQVVADAKTIVDVLRHHPTGIGTAELRAQLKLRGVKMGPERMDTAMALLRAGHHGVHIIDRGQGGDRAPRVWTLKTAS